jgi:uncharacterized membrane protein YeiH
MVLRAEIYAVAALAGAAMVVIGHLLRLPSIPVAIAGAILCFGLRLLAIRHSWNLPVAREADPSATETNAQGNQNRH